MSKNDTSTGGYVLPAPEVPAIVGVSPKLTFVQFIQKALVGLSGFKDTLVRPEWQQQPPQQPNIDTDWLAFGLGEATAEFTSYNGFDVNGNPVLIRNELLPISVSVYGPNSYENIGMIRDGFQIPQNLEAFRTAKIGFAYDTTAQHLPDFFNERWYDKWRIEFFIRRQIQRDYAILTFLSASGTINSETAVNDNFNMPFSATGR